MKSGQSESRQRAAVLAVAVFITFGLAGCSTTGIFAADDYRPSERLEPEDVVSILIDVLSDTDDPAGGVEVAYRFHTPEGPGNIATLGDYRALLDRPEYLPQPPIDAI